MTVAQAPGSNRDRPLRRRRRLLLLAFGLVMFAITNLLAHFPPAAESAWGARIGPFVTWTLSLVTGPLPFSLIELLFAAWLVWRLSCVARGLRDVFRRARRGSRAAAAFVLVLAQDAGVATGVFYLTWGLSYARPAVESRLGWPSREIPAELVTRLAESEIEAANLAYRTLHGCDDAGEPTASVDPARLDDALEAGWHRGAEELGMGGITARRHGAFKRLWISPLLRRAGLSGFYAPFTGEANVNRSVPAVSLPQVVAHEKAHQRAIAPEDEANFFGWWAAACAPDPLARYSAHVFAQRQLLQTLARTDREAVKELLARRLPGVQRDVDDLHAYWELARGRAGRITRAVNDAYLKTHRVEGGVAAYGGSVELLLRFAAGRGGTLATPPLRPEAPGPSRRAGRE